MRATAKVLRHRPELTTYICTVAVAWTHACLRSGSVGDFILTPCQYEEPRRDEVESSNGHHQGRHAKPTTEWNRPLEQAAEKGEGQKA